MNLFGIIYLLIVSFFGVITAFILPIELRKFFKLFIGPALGIVIITTLTLLVSLICGFNQIAILVSLVFYLVILFILRAITTQSEESRSLPVKSSCWSEATRLHLPEQGSGGQVASLRFYHPDLRRDSRMTFFSFLSTQFKSLWPFLFILSTIGVLVIYIFATQVLTPTSSGLVTGGGGLWGDTAMHSSFTMSLAEQGLPPHNPLFAGRPLVYPFLVNFFSAILVKVGISLRIAFILPQIAYFLGFLALFYAITQKFTGKLGTILTMLIFFLGWGLGFTQYYTDINVNHSLAVTREYTNGLFNFYLHNPLTGLIFPERAMLPGLFIGMLITLLIISDQSKMSTFRHPELTDNCHPELVSGSNFKNNEIPKPVCRQAGKFGMTLLKSLFINHYSPARNAFSIADAGGLIIAGFLLGILPLWHTHTFIVFGVSIFFWFLLCPSVALAKEGHSGTSPALRDAVIESKWDPTCLPARQVALPINRDRSRMTINLYSPACIALRSIAGRLFVIYGIAFIVALPTLLWFKSNLDGSFLHLMSGWMLNQSNFFNFWWKNTGLLIPLSILGVLSLSFWSPDRNRDDRISNSFKFIQNTKYQIQNILLFFLPFFILFFIANFVSFQPWDWDNIKIFTWIFLFLSIPTGHFLSQLITRHPERSEGSPSIFFILKSLFIIFIFISLTASGTLSLINQSKNTFTIYDNNDINMANWVKNNTKPFDIFLVDPQPTHPLQGLTGRSAFMGYAGHLWVHGISYGTREAIVNRVLKGEVGALNEADVKINYLVIDVNKKINFLNHPNLKSVFTNQKYLIYKII